MKGPRDVHYNEEGNQMLGVRVAATFATLLDQEPKKRRPPHRKAIVRRYFEQRGYSDYYIPDDAITCPDAVTRCPIGSTCCESLISLTGYGCCMFPNAVNCPDNWHCCPSGSTCSPTCNVRECKCITYTTTKNRTTISHESKANAKYLAENNLLNSGTAEHIGKNFKPITDPLLNVLKKLANAHKTSKEHPKKNAQMWSKKLFESKGKLEFKNMKSSKTKTSTTKDMTTDNGSKSKQHSINVELGHLIEHHHKHKYKDLKNLLNKGMRSKGRASMGVKNTRKHLHLKDKHFKVKSMPRKLVKTVVRQKGKLYARKHQKLLNKKHFHNNSHKNPESHHTYPRPWPAIHELEGGKESHSGGKDGPSKSHVDHGHQRNSGRANERLHSAAKHSLHRLANHNQSFKYKFVADRKTLMKDLNNNSYGTKLKADKESHGISNVGGKSKQGSFDQHHSLKDEHIYSGDDSGSGEGSGLSDSGLHDSGSASSNYDEEYVSGSGMRDKDPSPINPNLDESSKGSDQVRKHSTIQSSKVSAHNTSSEREYSTSATSGSETPLLNVLLSDSREDSNAMRDDLNPSGDGQETRESSSDSDISSASGESLDQTLGESVDDKDDHGFDLMSSALMDNDGANNEVIKEEQSAEKRENVASNTDGRNSQLTGTIKKTTIHKVRIKSSLFAGEGSDENEDDDIRGEYVNQTEHTADYGMDKEPIEDKERVEVDFDDNNNLISLDSLLEDNSGYSNEAKLESSEQAGSSTTPPESRSDAGKETPMRSESETGLKNESPLGGLASEYPDDTQAIERSAIKGRKTDLVDNSGEGSASGNLLPESEIMGQNPTLVEDSKKNVSTSLTKSTSKTTTNLVDGSKNKTSTSISNSIGSSSKGKRNPLLRNDNAVKHVNPSIISHSDRKQNHVLSENQEKKDTKTIKDGGIQLGRGANLKKKKEPKTTTSKTFVRKLPKRLKNNNNKNRQMTVLGIQGHQKIDFSSHSELKNSSEGDKASKNAVISSSPVIEQKRLRNYVLYENEKKGKHRKNNRHSVIGERDDISSESIDDDQTSVSEQGSGRGMLEAYLAAP